MKHTSVNQNQKITTIISLEGNIGSGKENILTLLKRHFNDNLIILDDSIYTWENKGLIKNYYENPERWAFTLEVFSTLQKSKRLNDIITQKTESLAPKYFNGEDINKQSLRDKHTKQNIVPHHTNTHIQNKCEGNFIITRRSIVSDRDCFVKACKLMGYISEQEQNIYDFIFGTIKIPKYTCVIYLKSNVNKCYETIINKRSTNEKEISFDYLRCIHDNYENWVSNLKRDNVNVIEIDAEKFRNIDNNEYLQESFIEIMKQHFPLLMNNEHKPPRLRKSVSLKNYDLKNEDFSSIVNNVVSSKHDTQYLNVSDIDEQNFKVKQLDSENEEIDNEIISSSLDGQSSTDSPLGGPHLVCLPLKNSKSFVDSIRKSHSVNAL